MSAASIQVDSDKTKAVDEFPVPTNLKAAVPGHVVPNFSQLAGPLNALKRKGAKFKWTPECLSAFETLKMCLVSPPILSNPNPDLPFVVYTDASDVGLGAVLAQKTRLARLSPIWGATFYVVVAGGSNRVPVRVSV